MLDVLGISHIEETIVTSAKFPSASSGIKVLSLKEGLQPSSPPLIEYESFGTPSKETLFERQSLKATIKNNFIKNIETIVVYFKRSNDMNKFLVEIVDICSHNILKKYCSECPNSLCKLCNNSRCIRDEMTKGMKTTFLMSDEKPKKKNDICSPECGNKTDDSYYCIGEYCQKYFCSDKCFETHNIIQHGILSKNHLMNEYNLPNKKPSINVLCSEIPCGFTNSSLHTIASLLPKEFLVLTGSISDKLPSIMPQSSSLASAGSLPPANHMPSSYVFLSSKNFQSTKDLTHITIESVCATCGEYTHLKCSKCKKLFVCSRECQERIWNFHKLICRTPDKEPQIGDTVYLTSTLNYLYGPNDDDGETKEGDTAKITDILNGKYTLEYTRENGEKIYFKNRKRDLFNMNKTNNKYLKYKMKYLALRNALAIKKIKHNV